MTETDYVSTETDTKLGSDGTVSLPVSTDLQTKLVNYLNLQPRDPESGQFVQAFRQLVGKIIENVAPIDVTCISEETFGADSYIFQLQHIGTDRAVVLRVTYGGNQFSAKAVMEEHQKVSRAGNIGDVVNRMLVHLNGSAKQKTKKIKRPYAGAVESDESHGYSGSQFDE